MAGDHERAAGAVPFWAHQLAEMLLGALLLIEGARTGQHTAVLAGLGGALLLLSLLSDGALGAWSWIGRRFHRVLDIAAAVALAASPLVLSLGAVLPIVVLEAAALGMMWLALRTNWTPRRARGRVGSRAEGRAETSPTAHVEPAPPVPAPGARASPAPPLARQLGGAVGKAKADGPRRLGRAVGKARAKARRPPTADP